MGIIIDQTEEVYGNYVLKGNGLYIMQENDEGEMIEKYIGRHLKIKEVHQDIETQSVWLVLEYWFKGRMQEILISRKQLEVFELRKLLEKGVDVPDHKAKAVATFLSIQEDKAPLVNVHRQVGWMVRETEPIYRHHDAIGSQEWVSQYEGDLLLKPKGSFEEWKKIMEEEVLGQTPLELALIMGCSAPVVGWLSAVLDMDTLLFHICGDSTSGKTSASRVAVSPFGYPSTRKGGLIHTWNGTQNAIIGKLIDNRGLPVVLDEASMNRIEDFTSLIYQMAGGIEKSRMTKEAELKERKSWSTSIITTAEHSLLEKSNKNVGLMMRVFEFRNIVWTKNATNADRLKFKLLQNYGHASVKFVAYLQELGQEALLERWRYWANVCLEALKVKDQFSSRIADKFAVLMTTGELVKEAFDFEIDLEAVLTILVEQDQQASGGRDIGENAYAHFMNRLYQHRSKFQGEYFPENGHECWGKIINKGAKKEVYIIPNKLRDWLSEGGFSDTTIVLRKWEEKGYIQKSNGKYQVKKTVHELSDEDKQKDGRASLYCILVNKHIFDVDEIEMKPRKITNPPKQIDFEEFINRK